MSFTFVKAALGSNEFLRDLALELGYPGDKELSYNITRAVLHIIRDHLSMEESLMFLGQLPFCLKAIFVDGWSSHQLKRISSPKDLLVELQNGSYKSTFGDFHSEAELLKVVKTTLKVLRKHISEEGFEEIWSFLPVPFKQLTAVPKYTLLQ